MPEATPTERRRCRRVAVNKQIAIVVDADREGISRTVFAPDKGSQQFSKAPTHSGGLTGDSLGPMEELAAAGAAKACGFSPT